MVNYSAAQLDNVFLALSHQTRRSILLLLDKKPKTIAQLAGSVKLSLPAMNKHIKILERAHLIQRKKVGRDNYIALNPTALRNAHEWLRFYEQFWNERFDSIEEFLTKLEKET